jgi:hypothetical protein
LQEEIEVRKILPFLLIMPIAVTLAGIAFATPITFTGSSGNLAASANFAVSGSNLVVTLTNTSTADVMAPTDVLTAVFFTLAGDPTLTRTSAVLANGSSVLFKSQPSGGIVGGEWAYKDGLSGAPLGADEGISSAGFGLFGSGDRFPGSNLQNNASPAGLEYGITSAGDNPSTGANNNVKGTYALIKNSVVFTLGFPNGFAFDPNAQGAITNVSFQYGTALTEPNVDPPAAVPEPATMLLVGSGLIGVGVFARRRFKR